VEPLTAERVPPLAPRLDLVFHPGMLSLLTASLARIPATQRNRLATALARLPGLEARRRAHRDSVRIVLGAVDDASATTHHEAVRRHFVWALEFLAEMGGHRHPVEDRTTGLWDPRDRARLIVTAHHGNWIVGARALARAVGPIHTVAGVQLQRAWQPAIRAHLRGQGIELTDLAGLRRALGRGGTVVLHLDGKAGPYRRRGVPVGVRSAALLAAESDAAVYAATCMRIGAGRFALEGMALRPDASAIPAAASTKRIATCANATTNGIATRANASTNGKGARPDLAREASRARIAGWERSMLKTLREWILRDPADWLLFSPDHLSDLASERAPVHIVLPSSPGENASRRGRARWVGARGE